MPHPGFPRVDFVAGKLPSLAGLGALRHFNLQFTGIDEVVAGDSKPRGSNLLDGAVARIATGIQDITGRVLTSLTGIAFSADPVHGDGERFVRFFADRAIRHRPGLESCDYRVNRLDL